MAVIFMVARGRILIRTRGAGDCQKRMVARGIRLVRVTAERGLDRLSLSMAGFGFFQSLGGLETIEDLSVSDPSELVADEPLKNSVVLSQFLNSVS